MARKPCPETCPGPDAHTRCGAHNRAGRPWGGTPLPGTQSEANPHGVCHLHGGRAPQVQAQAARRLALDDARNHLNALTVPRPIDPATALLEEVQRAAGAVHYCEARIAELDPELIVRGTRSVRRVDDPEKGVTTTTEVGPALNAWVKLWNEQRRMLVDASARAIAADVDTRLVRLAEQQGSLLADVIAGILDDLNLTAAQRASVPSVVPRHLRLVAGAG